MVEPRSEEVLLQNLYFRKLLKDFDFFESPKIAAWRACEDGMETLGEYLLELAQSANFERSALGKLFEVSEVGSFYDVSRTLSSKQCRKNSAKVSRTLSPNTIHYEESLSLLLN